MLDEASGVEVAAIAPTPAGEALATDEGVAGAPDNS